MSTVLNTAGVKHAKGLISAGKVAMAAAWSFSAADANALLGDPPDWAAYSRWFLGRDNDADLETKKAWKYPVGKAGEVYRRALIAAKSRASQQGDDTVAAAADALLNMLPTEDAVSDDVTTRVEGSPPARFVSINEWHEARVKDQDIGQDVGIWATLAVEEVKKTADGFPVFLLSDDTIDRYRDSIDPNGWVLKDYKRNPVILWSHDSRMVPIGRARSIGVESVKGKPALVAAAEFAPGDVYPFAGMIGKLVELGFIKAVSVGFRSLKEVWNEARSGWDILKAELWEFSIVAVGAHPGALLMSKGVDLAPLEAWLAQTLDCSDGMCKSMQTSMHGLLDTVHQVREQRGEIADGEELTGVEPVAELYERWASGEATKDDEPGEAVATEEPGEPANSEERSTPVTWKTAEEIAETAEETNDEPSIIELDIAGEVVQIESDDVERHSIDRSDVERHNQDVEIKVTLPEEIAADVMTGEKSIIISFRDAEQVIDVESVSKSAAPSPPAPEDEDAAITIDNAEIERVLTDTVRRALDKRLMAATGRLPEEL